MRILKRVEEELCVSVEKYFSCRCKKKQLLLLSVYYEHIVRNTLNVNIMATRLVLTNTCILSANAKPAVPRPGPRKYNKLLTDPK